MAAKSRRRRTVPKPPPLGRQSWIIRDATGNVVKETPYGKGPALLMTHRRAEQAEAETFFTVERHDLFGPPAVLYRVVREENGDVQTHVLSQED